jgi:hypothetical protein
LSLDVFASQKTQEVIDCFKAIRCTISFIPGGTTGFIQVCDTVVNRSLKARIMIVRLKLDRARRFRTQGQLIPWGMATSPFTQFICKNNCVSSSVCLLVLLMFWGVMYRCFAFDDRDRLYPRLSPFLRFPEFGDMVLHGLAAGDVVSICAFSSARRPCLFSGCCSSSCSNSCSCSGSCSASFSSCSSPHCCSCRETDLPVSQGIVSSLYPEARAALVYNDPGCRLIFCILEEGTSSAKHWNIEAPAAFEDE